MHLPSVMAWHMWILSNICRRPAVALRSMPALLPLPGRAGPSDVKQEVVVKAEQEEPCQKRRRRK